MNKEMLLEKLAACIAACNHCADACLEEEHVQHMINCIRTDRVCAAVCTAVHQVAATRYSNMVDLLEVCIRICGECAAECEKHEHDHCRECARACRECAEACRSYMN